MTVHRRHHRVAFVVGFGLEMQADFLFGFIALAKDGFAHGVVGSGDERNFAFLARHFDDCRISAVCACIRQTCTARFAKQDDLRFPQADQSDDLAFQIPQADEFHFFGVDRRAVVGDREAEVFADVDAKCDHDFSRKRESSGACLRSKNDLCAAKMFSVRLSRAKRRSLRLLKTHFIALRSGFRRSLRSLRFSDFVG